MSAPAGRGWTVEWRPQVEQVSSSLPDDSSSGRTVDDPRRRVGQGQDPVKRELD